MPEVWLELDTALKERLRRVLDDPQGPVTEAELRKLSEEGRACTLILGAELERLEQRLAELDGDHASSLDAIADAFRRVHNFRAHLEELDGLSPRSRVEPGMSGRPGCSARISRAASPLSVQSSPRGTRRGQQSAHVRYVPGEQVAAIFPGEITLKIASTETDTLKQRDEAAEQDRTSADDALGISHSSRRDPSGRSRP